MKHLLSALILVLISQPASAYLDTWGMNATCGLDQYIQKYNELNPPKLMFIENVARAALADAPEPPVVRIDKDLQSEALAGQVVDCMVSSRSTEVESLKIESTLRLAYQRYFYDRNARRAIWTFLQVLDATYLNKDAQVDSIQHRDSWLVTFGNGAKYGVWIASVALFVASKFRGTLPAEAALPGKVMTENMTKAERMALVSSQERSMTFRQFGKNTLKFVKIAVPSGVAVGGPIYLARQQGWLPTRDNTAENIVELTYHRMHWLELDCRARAMETDFIGGHSYKDASDPQFKADSRDMNHLVNDFDFLTDISQLYYVELEWPKDMQWDAHSVVYKDIHLNCPGGFSKPDVTKITANDARASIARAAKAYLKIYGAATAGPFKEKISEFLDKNNAEIMEALNKAPNDVRYFFLKVTPQIASYKEAGPEQLLKLITAYRGKRNRVEGRDPFYQKFKDFLKTLKPDTQAALSKLVDEVIARLPAALMNEAVLEIATNGDRFPSNMIFLFALGTGLDEAAKANPPAVADLDQYIVPNELMFKFYEPLNQEIPKEVPKILPKEQKKDDAKDSNDDSNPNDILTGKANPKGVPAAKAAPKPTPKPAPNPLETQPL